MERNLGNIRQAQNPHGERTKPGVVPVKIHITRNLTKCDIV